MTEQFLEFIDDDLKVNIAKFENFSVINTKIEDFTLRLLGIEKYKEHSFLVKIVLTLNHLQASAERGFSLNN